MSARGEMKLESGMNIFKSNCQKEHESNPDYKDAVKLKAINHGNCDFCEVSIQKVYCCIFCKKTKCESCIREVYMKKINELL